MASFNYQMWGVALAGVLLLGSLVLLLRRWHVWQRSERRRLRVHFGPEYAHLVAVLGSQWRAVHALRARERRVRSLSIAQLSNYERANFEQRFHLAQACFVDRPLAALREAERLIESAMIARGYRLRDPEQQLDDLSVHFAEATYGYRCARELLQQEARDTEQLRRAFIQYRQLFAQLIHSNLQTTQHRYQEARS